MSGPRPECLAGTGLSLSRELPDRTQAQYTAAQILAGCVALVHKDAQLDEKQRGEQAERYGAEAVRCLRRAADQGYHNVRALKEARDFEPIRHRADFHQLLGKR